MRNGDELIGRAGRGALGGARDDLLTFGLLLFGVPSLLLGVAMAFAPGAFFDLIGPYGPRNDHYIHDTASFQIALAALLLIALRRPSWRVPALTANAVQWGLHAISHVLDVGAAEPAWIGWFDLFATTTGTGLLIALAVLASRAHPTPAAP
jgi:hypothetical protein